MYQQSGFFYSTGRNYLWKLLTRAYEHNDLSNKSIEEKKKFMLVKKIDFIDLISEVSVDDAKKGSRSDKYIDDKVTVWRNVLKEIDKLKYIKKVCFSRKTLKDIPEISKHIKEIEMFCVNNKISFKYLKTPARFYSNEKQILWSDFLISSN